MPRSEAGAAADRPTHALSRRGLLVGAGAAAALPALGGVAYAHDSDDGDRDRRVTVSASADRVTLSRTRVPAGVVTLDIGTTAAKAAPGLLRLRAGTTIDSFLDAYEQTGSPDPATRAAAIARIDTEAEYLGGAAVNQASGRIQSVAWLTPGTYYVFNYGSVGTPGFRASAPRLDVTAPGRSTGHTPRPTATIAYYDAGPDGHYLLPARFPRCGTFLIANQTEQINEVMFLPLLPTATDADVAAWVAAIRNHTVPPPAPFAGGPVGAAPLTAGFTNLVQWSFPRGRYMVTSFMSNRRTQVKRAFEGMYSIVELV